MLRKLLMVGLLLTAASTASAVTTNFGDFTMADDVMFMQVIEENFEMDPLYAVTGTSGNTLTIDPLNFGVQVDPEPGDPVPQSNILDSDLRMTIIAKDDFSINEIHFAEQGDFQTSGSGSVNATVSYFWDITGVNNNPVLVSGQGIESMNVSDGLWDVEFVLDLAQELADAGLSGDITKVKFRFDNTLTGSVLDDGSFAFIRKKQIGGVTISIPEPTSIIPMLMGLMGLLRWRRS